jgi:hypothetical protein
MTYVERMSMLRLVGRDKVAPLAAPGIFSAAGKAAKQIGTAHAALREAAVHHKLTSKELLAALEDLAVTGQTIREFYEKLQKKD